MLLDQIFITNYPGLRIVQSDYAVRMTTSMTTKAVFRSDSSLSATTSFCEDS